LSGFREEFGLDFILMEVAQGGAPHDKVCHALETFAAGVIPRVRSYQPRAHASTT
jgi:hypothetical protein